MARRLGFLNRINGYKLDPELLMGAMNVIADMEPDDRQTFEGRTIKIVRFIHEQNLPDEEERHLAALSINFRLNALAHLKLPDFPEWMIAGREGAPDLLNDGVVRCAAIEPLIREGEDLRFDESSFTKRLYAMDRPGVESRLRLSVARVRQR